MALCAHRAELLSVPKDPRTEGAASIIHHPDGLLVIEDGMIIAAGGHAELSARFAELKPIAWPGKLIVPGFVDCHVHYPQIDMIAAHGGQLLDWLTRTILPGEAAFADPAHARATAAFFLDELLETAPPARWSLPPFTNIRWTRCSKRRWRVTCASSLARC